MTDTGDAPDRSVWTAMRRGLAQRCPRCGEAPVFERYLKIRPDCPNCGVHLGHARADDGPAYLTILIVAKIMGPLLLYAYIAFRPAPLLLAGVFSVGVVALSLWLLPRLKGMIVGIQWANRMHGF